MKFKKGDLDAGVAVFFDSFSKIIIASGILLVNFKLEKDLVLAKILSATALTVFIGSIFSYLLAKQLAKKQTKSQEIRDGQAKPGGATALFAGVSSTCFFVWISAIMLPTYLATGDPILAWRVTLAVSFIYSLLQIVLAFLSEKIFKLIPADALKGAIIGGCLAWMIISPISQAMTRPWLFIISLFILLTFFLGRIKFKYLPTALAALLLGTALYWLSGQAEVQEVSSALSHLGFYLPSFQFAMFQPPVLTRALNFLPLILAYILAETTANIQAFAEAKGPEGAYPVKSNLLTLALVNLLGSLLGNPFPLNYYWGHSTWKKVGAGEGYPLVAGTLHLLICFTGISALVAVLVPTEVSLIMLVFVGLNSAAFAISESSSKYYPAIVLAAAIPIFELINNQLASSGNKAFASLAQGSMVIAILYASILIMVIDRRWIKAAAFASCTALLSLFGLIHSNGLGLGKNPQLAISYLALAGIFLFLGFREKKVGRQEKKY